MASSVRCHCVAGIRTPAFVERWLSAASPCQGTSVAGIRTPAFVERERRVVEHGVVDVSPGFAPRPSLSDYQCMETNPAPESVAGIRTPAFVERASPTMGPNG